MKILHADEYIKRTDSADESLLLCQELKQLDKSLPCHHGRTLCDRVIRACHHQLGFVSLDYDHINQLVELVEVALHHYDVYAVAKSSPLYMEKIIFHVVSRLCSLQVHNLCRRVAALLHTRLASLPRDEHYYSLVRNCFSVLWNRLSTTVDQNILNPKDKLRFQFQALNFHLLLDNETATLLLSKAHVYLEFAVNEFVKTWEAGSEEDASFVLNEIRTLFSSFWHSGQGRKIDGSTQFTDKLGIYTFIEMALVVVKMLCKTGHYSLASVFLNDIVDKVKNNPDCQAAALKLGKSAIKIHSMITPEELSDKPLRECTRVLRSLPLELGECEAYSVLEGCELVCWVVENCYKKGFNATVLLAWLSFLEEHQELIMRILKSSVLKSEFSRLQKILCVSYLQGFGFAYESMVQSQLEEKDTLTRVLLYCNAAAGQMLTEMHKRSDENLLLKAVVSVNNLTCALYNRRLYDEAFTLLEILCHDLRNNCHASFPIDKLNPPFMLAVQASRRAGHLERALDWVILWLKVLGDKITLHMKVPISLWVKIKIDAARNSEADLRLRTLCDGFAPGLLDERLMLCLLEEELRAYKEEAGDTSKERYNTLCDLLDICHEDSSHKHQRAVYLCEMAQVVCFQDFSEQTDCTAVDFACEALRLLEEEPETPENTNRLKDDKAHALLWVFICTLEKNLQEAIERDVRFQEMRKQSAGVENPVGTNDFDYEGKQNNEDNTLVHDGLQFSLAAQNKLCEPLERALTEWAALLHTPVLPSVRNPKWTYNSIVITASLFQLMGKPLKALEAYQLSAELSRQLSDTEGCVYSLCQSASLFLEMGSSELALAQTEQAEKMVKSDASIEGPSPLSLFIILLKSQCCYMTGLVDRGVSYLCDVLKEATEQKCTKSWYMLRAQALQTCSSYLSLDTASLPQTQRSRIIKHGFKSPDTTLAISQKLLVSLLASFVGNGFYGAHVIGSDVRFFDTGNNLMFKWRLLSELLNCSMKVIMLRTTCGAINDARMQCREALKLAIKLQALSQCAELLVVKAELELMLGEVAESGFDLDKVKTLLEFYSDFSDLQCKSQVKIKPRKGCPSQKSRSTMPVKEDDLEDILSTRWTVKEAIVNDESSSPPLKAKPHLWLSCLSHKPTCLCLCCSEPFLGRVTARWAAAQALVLQVDPAQAKVSFKLQKETLARCKMITAKLKAKLAEFNPAKRSPKPSLMHSVIARVYLHMALSSLEPSLSKVCNISKIIEAGLAFVDSVNSPELRAVKANLMATKALVSMIILSTKKNCKLEELFSNVWTWKAPKDVKVLKTNQSSLKEPKSLSVSEKKKPTKVKVPGSATKGKVLTPIVFPKTPVNKSKSSARELSIFDFSTDVLASFHTPAQKAKAPAKHQKSPKTAPKVQFQVFELPPAQDKVKTVPAAPRRTKKSRFKVDFSDESDVEYNAQEEYTKKLSKKTTTTRQATRKSKASSATPSAKILPTRPARHKSTALTRDTSSEDETLVFRGPSTRLRRGRKVSGKESEFEEEPDKMRSIDEETNDVLNLSFEYLETSETETKDCKDFVEVMRRDLSCDLERNDFLRKSKHPARDPQPHIFYSDTGPDNLSLEDIQGLLRSAWLKLQHFPSPTIFPTLCSFLALSMGQQHPITTAMLHSQSLGITSRHLTIRHLANCLKKQRKTATGLTDQMDNLTLDESSPTASITDQKLSQLESIFSFSTADCSAFPQNHCQEFIQQIEHLPSGVTVCVMSVLGVKVGQVGGSILLTRLEKGSTPVTVHIPTPAEPHSIRGLVQEMDAIKVDQKTVLHVSEKALWWEGCRALDLRVELLLKEMEQLLGCWKSLFLPLSMDKKLASQAKHLSKILCAKGITASEEMLKVVLSASPLLSQKDLRSFAQGVCPEWDDDCEQILRSAVWQFPDREVPCGHTVLILDRHLQKLPWESISFLKFRSVSRMPSLQSLIGLSVQKENDPQSILNSGVDTQKSFYLLDPDANLENTQKEFKELLSSKLNLDGVCGHAPKSGQLEGAVATKDLYLYLGHGAGARFLDQQAVLNRPMRAASLLIGCSSAALAVRGDQEGQGIILYYLMAGCPFVLGNLWDVTDRDINRFTKALLDSWFASTSGSALLDYMGPSREATHMKHLIGAAPVVYGLPIQLR
ncbi:separin [Corythoichthys intestinalis]|uniref:separin n=1 Tax=Corythoichthys intestinalis TaxID=161448 RepID=UPI0025A5EBB2|nr:separin [Corythoichthys intestinalis]